MNSKDYFNWFFLFLLLTIICCVAENSDHKQTESAISSINVQPVDTNSKYEAAEIKLQGEAIIEITFFEPNVNTASQNSLLVNPPIKKVFKKSDYSSTYINLLTHIRKDYLYLSILRI